MSGHRLKRERAALLVIDVQERLGAAMNPAAFERLVKRTAAAIGGAKALGIPVVATEQYPKGLGPTLPALAGLLDKPVEKVNFSCALDEVLAKLQGRDQILMVGMETHVCVFQTARDLSERKLTPFLLTDAVLSRTEEDRQVGLELCRNAGAVISSVETALFDLLGKAGTPEFKIISGLIK
jgi:nicotinamidase-related amidase